METQIENGRSNQITRQHTVKSGYKWFLVVLAALSVVLIAAILITGLPPTDHQTNHQLADEAGAARYTALGVYYKAKDFANRQRAIDAETARYSGLADIYLDRKKTNLLRAHEAEAARYSALEVYYKERDVANRQRAIEADAARYSGLADFYTASDNQ